jgi:SAM-dependent methyltransferase
MQTDHRARARELAAQSLAKGDALGWFEHLYREAEVGKAAVPWADRRPNLNLLSFWEQNAVPAAGKRALVVGCGLGDDAEQLAAWGFQTTAFDIAESAIRACRRRFPDSRVHYAVADLLTPPPEWNHSFDFVSESYTLQVLPPELREPAFRSISGFVRDSGALLVIARGRDEHEAEGTMPWPLTRRELERLANPCALSEVSFEEYFDDECPPVRRFRAFYRRAPGGAGGAL